jgi:8-amino-7-oxononanoate synthase
MKRPPLIRPVDPTHIEWRGRRLTYFGGSDYFRYSWHSKVRAAVCSSIKEYGFSVAASRITTGDHPLYRVLERELEKFFGFEAALLTGTGYAAPGTALQGLSDQVTGVLLDERAHSCLSDAAILADRPVVRFRHHDSRSLALALRRFGRNPRCVVLAEGLSPLFGDIAPLHEYLTVLPRDTWLLIDDAHGVGVLGRHGRGALEHLGLKDPRIILTCTFSKAFGTYGGAILASRRVRNWITARSRSYAGSTPLPLPLAAAVRAALQLIRTGDERRERLEQNIRVVKRTLKPIGLGPEEKPGPMFSLAPRSERSRKRLQGWLLEAGLHPPLIRYAHGPSGEFFRFALSSEHDS